MFVNYYFYPIVIVTFAYESHTLNITNIMEQRYYFYLFIYFNANALIQWLIN